MIWCAIAEHVMKDWSCERLVLVGSINAFAVAHIVGPHLGCSVDEDAMVKLTEAQVAYALNDCNVLMCLNGFNIGTDEHMVAVIPCMVSGFRGHGEHS